MAKAAPIQPRTKSYNCAQCGAAVRAEATRCWLCNADLAQSNPDQFSLTHASRTAGSSSSFSLASLMMLVTLLSIICGVWSIYPGLGIILGAILIAVWARTATVVRKRAAIGEAVSVVEKAQVFVSTFAVSAAMIVVVGVTAVAALATACGVMIATMDSQAVPFAAGAALVAALGGFLTYLLAKRLSRM